MYNVKGVACSDHPLKNYHPTLQFYLLASFSSLFWFYVPQLLSSTLFPAAAGSCFQQKRSDKPTIATDKLASSCIYIHTEHSGAKYSPQQLEEIKTELKWMNECINENSIPYSEDDVPFIPIKVAHWARTPQKPQQVLTLLNFWVHRECTLQSFSCSMFVRDFCWPSQQTSIWLPAHMNGIK